MRDGGLAVGAGDGGDDARLSAVEAGGEAGQRQTRIVGAHDGKTFGCVQRRIAARQCCDCATRRGVGEEAAAIDFGAAHRREQITRPDGARIGADPENVGSGLRRLQNRCGRQTGAADQLS